MRRVLAPVGETPTARFNRGYQCIYLYFFVLPKSVKVFCMILLTVHTQSPRILRLSMRFRRECRDHDSTVLVTLEG